MHLADSTEGRLSVSGVLEFEPGELVEHLGGEADHLPRRSLDCSETNELADNGSVKLDCARGF